MTLTAVLLTATITARSLDDSTRKLPTEVRWSVALSAPPAAPPVMSGEQIYLPLQSGVVAAYRMTDGTEAWRRELPTSSPLAVDGGRVFVASGDTIYALNADGTSAWQADAGALTAPMLAQNGWLVAAAKDQLTAFRVTDGSIVWRRAMDATGERPSIEGNNLFVPLVDGRVLELDLATGRLKWERRLHGAPTEVLPFANRVYVGSADKYFYCLDTDDGEVSWRQQIGAVLRGRPAADATKVYVVALDNLLHAFDRGNGALRWSPRALPFRPTSGPVVFGRTVAVAGTTSQIHAFDAVTGQPAGELTLPESLGTLPAYGEASGLMQIAAVTGSLSEEWKLSFAVTTLPIPSVAVGPLTVLPGLPIPIPRPPG